MKKQIQHNQFLYLLVGIVIGGSLVWTIMASYANNFYGPMQMMGGGSRGMMGSNYQNGSTMDAHFIEQMIPHHEDAITMSEIALGKATRPDVRQLAESIIESQQREIDQMTSWYKEWYGGEIPTGSQVMNQHGMMGGGSMHMGMMGNDSDLSRLENADDFDRAFIEEMIPHHQMAVMMASMLKNGSRRPEMRNLADDIIRTQSDEIDRMRQWLRTW